MVDKFVFDKEFQEKLSAVNEAAYRYFKIKTEYDEVAEKLNSLLNKQSENNKELNQFLK
ncbi:MAG: hypothetical protein NUV47_02525 [Patescibacteria group bacterium]|nr:hypothetical protein [Patescibacteria group bacterium]